MKTDARLSKNKARPADEVENLYEAFLHLKTTEEVKRFLRDLCTRHELRMLVDRWWIVRLLDQNVPHKDIVEIANVSETTVSRVSNCLDDGDNGYRLVLGRLPTPAGETN
jgi:TrpR-related protein YerC/YecD